MTQFATKIRESIQKIYEWIFKTSKDELAEEIKDSFDKLAELATLPSTSEEDIEKWLKELEEKLRKKGSPELTVPISTIYEKTFKPLVETYFPTEAVPPDQLLSRARTMAGLSVAASLGSYGVGILAEALTLGQIDGAGKYWEKMQGAMGLHRVSALIFDLPVKLALLRPLGYEMNKQIRTYLPDMRTLEYWFGRSHVSEDEFKEGMGWHGISTDFFNKYKRSAVKPASYFMLNAIGREGLYDPIAFKFWLSDAGYGTFKITEDVLTPEDLERIPGLREALPLKSEVEFLSEAYERMSARTEWRGVRTLAQRLFKKGRIPESAFRDYMGKMFIGKPVQNLNVDLIKAEWEEELLDAKVDELREKFVEGEIDEPEFRSELGNYILIDDLLEAEVIKSRIKRERREAREKAKMERQARRAARRKVAEPRKLTKTELRRAFMNDQISTDVYLNQLIELGIDRVWAEVLVKTDLAVKERRARRGRT